MKVDTCIVPQDKWSHFEVAYENNVPAACDIAMQALNEIFKPKGIIFTDIMLWMKCLVMYLRSNTCASDIRTRLSLLS